MGVVFIYFLILFFYSPSNITIRFVENISGIGFYGILISQDEIHMFRYGALPLSACCRDQYGSTLSKCIL